MAGKRAPRRNVNDPNPPRSREGKGVRGDFLKVTVTMPSTMLGDLKAAGVELRAQGHRDTGVSELIRVAVHEWLQRRVK